MIETPMTIQADADQIGNDLYWKAYAGADGFIRWTGYDDANWWNRVSKTDAARERIGKVTARVYRLDHDTNVVTIL